MIRGGHVDVAVLGGMQVSQNPRLNWSVPGKAVTGMGGAMDLVSGAKKVICLMTHQSRSGDAKLVKECTMPLTGLGCVDVVITDFGVFEIDRERQAFVMKEAAPGISVETVEAATEGQLFTGRKPG